MALKLNLEKTPTQYFSKNLARIRQIQHIQYDLKACAAPKLELKTQYLNQTYVLQLVAYWQVFIAELAEYGFRQVEALEASGRFRDVARAKLSDALNRFNTPNRPNIDRLFREALGIDEISQSWAWKGVTRDQATSTLHAILDIRHEIAHTGKTSAPLTYESNFDCMNIIFRIAGVTENALIQQLGS